MDDVCHAMLPGAGNVDTEDLRMSMSYQACMSDL